MNVVGGHLAKEFLSKNNFKINKLTDSISDFRSMMTLFKTESA